MIKLFTPLWVILLDMITVAQKINKMATFVVVCLQWSVPGSYNEQDQPPLPLCISLMYILILSFQLHLSLSTGIFYSVSRLKFWSHFSLFLCVLHVFPPPLHLNPVIVLREDKKSCHYFTLSRLCASCCTSEKSHFESRAVLPMLYFPLALRLFPCLYSSVTLHPSATKIWTSFPEHRSTGWQRKRGWFSVAFINICDYILCQYDEKLEEKLETSGQGCWCLSGFSVSACTFVFITNYKNIHTGQAMSV